MSRLTGADQKQTLMKLTGSMTFIQICLPWILTAFFQLLTQKGFLHFVIDTID